jgi:hypothetical protein
MVALTFAETGMATGQKPKYLAITATYTPPDTCLVHIEGESFILPKDSATMTAKLQDLRKRWATASIVGGPALPYRCIGGAIYFAQRAGFERIGFTGEAHRAGSGAAPKPR